MPKHFRTDVERDDVDLSSLSEPKLHERIVNCKRLQRLERIKIVAVVFIGQIQAGSDHCDATDGSFTNCPASFHGVQCGADAEAEKNPRVERDATLAKHAPTFGTVGLRVALANCVIRLLLHGALFARHALEIFQDESFCLLIGAGAVDVHPAAFEHTSHKRKPLVAARVANAPQKIVQSRLELRLEKSRRARLIGKRGAEQEQIDHGIARALLKSRTNRGIFTLCPGVPLRLVRVAQVRRQLIREPLEDRSNSPEWKNWITWHTCLARMAAKPRGGDQN